jgi:hypothetical protein
LFFSIASIISSFVCHHTDVISQSSFTSNVLSSGFVDDSSDIFSSSVFSFSSGFSSFLLFFFLAFQLTTNHNSVIVFSARYVLFAFQCQISKVEFIVSVLDVDCSVIFTFKSLIQRDVLKHFHHLNKIAS